MNWNNHEGLPTTNFWDILILTPDTLKRRSVLGLNYVAINCHVVISKDSRFRLVKQLRSDTFRFTDRDRRFQNRIRINGASLSEGSIKLDLS